MTVHKSTQKLRIFLPEFGCRGMHYAIQFLYVNCLSQDILSTKIHIN